MPAPGPLAITDEEAGGVDAVPGAKPRCSGDRLAASYVNFHLGSTRIVFPLLDSRHDDEAAEVLRACFPDREIVGLPAREILLGGGNIHCITQQVPGLSRG
jgi:agmatine deiminase